MKTLFIITLALLAINLRGQNLSIEYENIVTKNVEDSLEGYKFRNIAFSKDQYMVLYFDTLVTECDVYIKLFEGQTGIFIFEYFSDIGYQRYETSNKNVLTFRAFELSKLRITATSFNYITNFEFRNVVTFDKSCNGMYDKGYSDGFEDGKKQAETVYVYDTVNACDDRYDEGFSDGINSCMITNKSTYESSDNTIYYSNGYISVDYDTDVIIYNINGVMIDAFKAPAKKYINYGSGVFMIKTNDQVRKIQVN